VAADDLGHEKVRRLLDERASGRIVGRGGFTAEELHHRRGDAVLEADTREEVDGPPAGDRVRTLGEPLGREEDVADPDRPGDVPATVASLRDDRDRPGPCVPCEPLAAGPPDDFLRVAVVHDEDVVLHRGEVIVQGAVPPCRREPGFAAQDSFGDGWSAVEDLRKCVRRLAVARTRGRQAEPPGQPAGQ
jgi:hypothetical protein